MQDFSSVLMLVERVHRLSQDRMRRDLSRLEFQDIEPGQAALVLAIGPHAISVGELARRGAYEGTGLSYHLRKLQQAGYTIQERTDSDKRVQVVSLSDKGRRLLQKLTHLREQSAAAFTPLTSQSDLQASCRTLEALEQFLRAHEDDEPSIEAPFSSEHRIVSAAETGVQPAIDREKVRDALRALPPEQRIALLLVRADDLSYGDAALVCGVSLGTVKSRVHRARERLADLLQIQR